MHSARLTEWLKDRHKIKALCQSWSTPQGHKISSGLVLDRSRGLGLGFHASHIISFVHYLLDACCALGTIWVSGDKRTKPLPSWSLCSSVGGAKLKKKKKKKYVIWCYILWGKMKWSMSRPVHLLSILSKNPCKFFWFLSSKFWWLKMLGNLCTMVLLWSHGLCKAPKDPFCERYPQHSSPLRAFWDNQPAASLSYNTSSFDKNRL